MKREFLILLTVIFTAGCPLFASLDTELNPVVVVSDTGIDQPADASVVRRELAVIECDAVRPIAFVADQPTVPSYPPLQTYLKGALQQYGNEFIVTWVGRDVDENVSVYLGTGPVGPTSLQVTNGSADTLGLAGFTVDAVFPTIFADIIGVVVFSGDRIFECVRDVNNELMCQNSTVWSGLLPSPPRSLHGSASGMTVDPTSTLLGSEFQLIVNLEDSFRFFVVGNDELTSVDVPTEGTAFAMFGMTPAYSSKSLLSVFKQSEFEWWADIGEGYEPLIAGQPTLPDHQHAFYHAAYSIKQEGEDFTFSDTTLTVGHFSIEGDLLRFSRTDPGTGVTTVDEYQLPGVPTHSSTVSFTAPALVTHLILGFDGPELRMFEWDPVDGGLTMSPDLMAFQGFESIEEIYPDNGGLINGKFGVVSIKDGVRVIAGGPGNLLATGLELAVCQN